MGLILGVLLDLFIGDPEGFPHPVVLMGKIISLEEKFFRKIFKSETGLKFAGFLMIAINMFISFFIPYKLLSILKAYKIFYSILNVYLIFTCIAARCLHKEGMKVYHGLNKGIEEGRYRLSFIVGRDTSSLNEEEIIKADVETISENTADGVIAPIIYIIILGAPGGFLYKMVNTMDSMVAYKNEKYKDLGYFPAMVDDMFNYIPARITGILMCLSSIFKYDVKNGFKIMWRDRKNHESPNASYPEGAISGLLNIQLGGDNYYFGKLVKKPTIGDRIRSIEKEDIKRAIDIMYRTEMLLILIYLILKNIK